MEWKCYMGIFNQGFEIENILSKSNKNQISKFIKRSLTKRYNVNGDSCVVTLEEVIFAEINGKEILLDEHLVNNTFEEIVTVIKRNNSKYNPVPKNIVIKNNQKGQLITNSTELVNDAENNMDAEELVNIYKPKWSLEEVYLDKSCQKQILTTLTISKYKDKLFNEWGLESSFKNGRSIIFNFFGQPGTGKSMAADAIAKYLNKYVCEVNYAQLESKFVGETPKNIKKVFEIATKKDAVIVFDEADSFLGKRIANVNQSSDYGVNITRSVMLIELEKFDGTVIFTTNLISNYDEAFKRRILASIEFNLPDKEGREIIWKTHIPNKLPLEDSITAKYLATKYEKISGADIKDILLNASVLCIQRGASKLSVEDFDLAYNYIAKRYILGSNSKIKSEVITKEQYETDMNINKEM